MAYKWLKTGVMLLRQTDNASIPADPTNKDYKEFLASGETPTPEDAPLSVDAQAGLAIDGLDRLNFEVNFDQENRLRVLEAKPAITKAQYRTALIARWKVLQP